MAQQRSSVGRKLKKQYLYGAGSGQDFIAQLSAETIIDRMVQSNYLNANGSLKGMLLYQPDSGTLPEPCDVLFDQVPFNQIQYPLERLKATLPAEHYSVAVSNLAFDWLDAGSFIGLLEYLLKPGGAFWFSSYGPQTAVRTRAILSKLDHYPHFNAFYDLRDIGDALLGAGFKDVVLESSIINLEYDSPAALLADAVRVFGVNMHPERCTSLTPKGVLEGFRKGVEEAIQADGVFSEQVEILIAHGQKLNVPGIKGMIPVRQS